MKSIYGREVYKHKSLKCGSYIIPFLRNLNG